MPSACIRVLKASKNSFLRGISRQIKALFRLRAFFSVSAAHRNLLSELGQIATPSRRWNRLGTP